MVKTTLFRHNIAQIMRNETFILTFCQITKLPYELIEPRIRFNGSIKVMKALGLYKTVKKGKDREIWIDKGLQKILFMFHGNSVERSWAFNDTTTDVNYRISTDFEALPSTLDQKKEKSTYIAYNPITNHFKIGRSATIKHRINGLRSNNKDKNIQLVATLPFDIEASLHAKYKQYHIGEEWFKFPSKDFVDSIITTYNFNRYTTSTAQTHE